ncbi:hypothetical protein [Flavobacterium sp. H122]|uniref:hypothetical protein n=1 Tax=Flavobacterium sp. H122 TaxID=2529860 RepID=UPI0010AA6427|nr:hypothetical protein [Flavobacterium sp. H122]
MGTAKETKEIAEILNFLNKIGITTVEKELPKDTFLPGLALSSKGIEIDFGQLLYPGDILHEAGHLAVTPSFQRNLIGTNEMPEEWPTQGDEIAAMLWSFAASEHLNLPIDLVFHPNGYKNQSEWLIENYSSGNYIGLPLLEWMGLTTSETNEIKKDIAFPKMIKWLRD